MSRQQKVLFLPTKFADNFVLGTAPIYKPGPGELLVKNKAASLNPVDWKVQKHGIFVEHYPAIVGVDIAGDVEEVGEGVTSFSKGDRVLSQGQFEPEWGGFQQYVKTRAVSTATIPANISYDQAATLPAALSAAYAGLYSERPNGGGLEPPVEPSSVGKYSGTPIVVLGGSSSVGQYAIQLAKLSGFSPIITTSSMKHENYLKTLGATHVIDRNLPPLLAVKKIANQSIPFVFDAIGDKSTQQAGLNILEPGGTLVTVLVEKVKAQDKTMIHVVALLTAPPHLKLLETLYGKKLSGWLEEGVIKPNRVEFIPGGLEAIPAGLKKMENDQVSGVKLVVHPQE